MQKKLDKSVTEVSRIAIALSPLFIRLSAFNYAGSTTRRAERLKATMDPLLPFHTLNMAC